MSEIKNLVIVESPAKAKTLGRFLGQDFKVMSSHGHIRDLKPHSFSIDTKTLIPDYIVPDDKLALVRSLRDAAKKADKVWLASDEDREGEAISWHLTEVLGLDAEKTSRIVFHEITKSAVLAAIENPRHVDQNLVNAQQARRVLDRIVGFELSPVLWRKIKPGLSAGRVQSVAVRLIVEKEREIEAFKQKAMFVVSGQFAVTGADGESRMVKAELNRRFASADEAKTFLEGCMKAEFTVEAVEQKPIKRSPAPPFMTSTMQQEAARKLGFSVSQTMRVAQGLYENGHITYMRTDSLNLSSYCIGSTKEAVISQMGEKYSRPRNFQTHAKGAQEAHEAIRPTRMDVLEIEGTPQEKRLYRLIYLRTMASQMADATFEKTTATITVSGMEERFVATGEVMTFDGFTRVYRESTDDAIEETTMLLPALRNGDVLRKKKIRATERLSQRPLRYSEASLVHKMEELGIGRPSTYAPTISTIQQRGYVEKGNKEGVKHSFLVLELQQSGVKESHKESVVDAEKGKLFPTDTGKIVNDFLARSFPTIMDFDFTAHVEKDFDAIAEGKKDWNKMVRKFYGDFTPQVAQAAEKQSNLKVGERQLGIDPVSGRMLSVKIGRYGPMAQLGLSTDAEKPRFAQLRDGMSLDTITFEQAMDLFKLPRILGTVDDRDVIANVSHYGPYVSYNRQNVSIPEGIDVMEITLEQAMELIDKKAEAEKQRLLLTLPGGIEVLNGRYGPYIAYQGRNYRLPKALAAEPAALTVEQCREVIEKADSRPASAMRGRRRGRSA
ncbi:MAG: type I DNA topoisomerase [Prevotellaceae bacterium]|nr:type I DNA topoisomerase [Prevotellaceae bacterium]